MNSTEVHHQLTNLEFMVGLSWLKNALFLYGENDWLQNPMLLSGLVSHLCSHSCTQHRGTAVADGSSYKRLVGYLLQAGITGRNRCILSERDHFSHGVLHRSFLLSLPLTLHSCLHNQVQKSFFLHEICSLSHCL